MKTLKLSFLAVLLVVAVVVPLLIQHRVEVRLRIKNETLQQQARLADGLAAENEHLLNIVAKAKSAQSLSEVQLSELLKLRNEFGRLNRVFLETNQIDCSIRRNRDSLRDLVEEKEKSNDSPTALLADQMDLRQARVARLMHWLDERPKEKIPELQFLSEEDWTRSAERTYVNDEEYRSWISSQRANAEMKFAKMTFEALKQYIQANNGQFPTDLSS